MPISKTIIEPRYLNQEQACAYLSISLPFLLQLERQFDLGKSRIGRASRYDRLKLDAFVKSKRITPAEEAALVADRKRAAAAAAQEVA